MPTPEEFSIEDVFGEARLPRQEVPICLRGDLVAAWQSLERRFKQANASADEDALASARPPEATQLAEQMTELQEQMRAATRVFLLEALPRSEWHELLGKHPPREDEQTEFNRSTFPIAAIAACTLVPKMTVAQAEKLAAEHLTQGQWDTLFAHVYMMNSSQVDVPFSYAASAATAASEPKPK